MQKKRIIGGLMFFVGVILILNSLSGITGFVIAESIGKGVGSILGLVLVVGGVLVFVARQQKEGELERTVKEAKTLERANVALNSRAMGSYKDLKRMATKMGYVVKNAKGHYKVFFNDGKTLLKSLDNHPVTIPRHHEKAGTYFGVLKNLVNNNPYQF